MKQFLLLWSLLLVVVPLLAQPPGGGGERGGRPSGGGRAAFMENLPEGGVIGGKLVDQKTGEPIPFASAVLFNAADSTQVEGMSTNERGRVLFTGLEDGAYYVKINFVGYAPKTIDNITVEAEIERFNRIGMITLEPISTELDEVVIASKRELVEMGLDKKVINVDQNIAAKGGNAVDMMKTLPSVTVDMEGAISLRGNSNVRVLIDGKVSNLTGSGRNAELENIPASAIKQVEVITNPSAKYDPEGTSGIINIILKKERGDGFNGKANVDIGTRNKYNAGLSLNYRKKKVNLFSSYNFRYDNRFRAGHRYQTYLTDTATVWMEVFDPDSIYWIPVTQIKDTTTQLNQLPYSDNLRISHQIKVGSDFFINARNTLTLSGVVSLGNRSGDGTIDNELLDANGIAQQLYDLVEVEDGHRNAYELSATYQKSFEERGRELKADVTYGIGERENVESSYQLYSLAETLPLNTGINNRQISTISDNSDLNLQVDYTHPLKDKQKLEIGGKSTFRNIDTDFSDTYFDVNGAIPQIDLTSSNRFIYEEQIHAAYLQYAGQYKRWAYQIGTRFEQAFTEARLIDSEDTFTNDYFSLFPSGSLSYQVSEAAKLQLTYSKRINRPRTRMLNPFTRTTDNRNIFTGNPFLKPEYIHSVELGFNQRWEKVSLMPAIYYRKTNNVMRRYTEVSDDNIRTTSFQNFLSSENYGIELVAMIRPTDWWRINTDANLSHTTVDASNLEAELTASGTTFGGKIMSNMTVWKQLEIQSFLFYRSPSFSPQGIRRQMFWFDIGLQKSVLKDKGTISFRLSDVFNTRLFNIDVEGDNFILDMQFRRESRIGYLGFSYRFGKEEKKKGRGRRGGGRSGGGGGFDDMEF